MNKVLRYLIRRKIRDYRQIDGWLSPDEAWGLYTTARKLPGRSTVVEIGSWQGKSTFCIAKGLRSGKVYAIDPFNADGCFDTVSGEEYKKRKGERDLLSIFRENIKKHGVDNKVEVRKGYSSDFHSEFTSLDFLFIDGDHSIEGCKNDYDLYAHKLKRGGFIAFHDYNNNYPELGPTYVINEIILKSGEFKFFNQFDSLWIGVRV